MGVIGREMEMRYGCRVDMEANGDGKREQRWRGWERTWSLQVWWSEKGMSKCVGDECVKGGEKRLGVPCQKVGRLGSNKKFISHRP